jgi:hypothetical protein
VVARAVTRREEISNGKAAPHRDIRPRPGGGGEVLLRYIRDADRGRDRLAARQWVSLALLKYKADEWAGMNKDAVCINRVGFWVDDLEKQAAGIKRNGGTFFRELPREKGSLYYEMKFRDPNGIIFDISHNGWAGAKK